MSAIADDPRRSRFYALALLAAVLMLVYFAFVHWTFVVPHLALREQLIDLRDQELRLRMAAATRPEIQQRLAQVREFEASNPGFLAEPSFDLAASALIQRLDNTVGELAVPPNRCQVVNKTPHRPREDERFDRVVLKVRMRCEMEEFSRVLHSLESASPQLFVDGLSIVARRPTYTPRNRPAPQGYLDISFDLYGYLRGGAQ